MVIKTFAIGERKRSASNIHAKSTLITAVHIATISHQIVGTYTATAIVVSVSVSVRGRGRGSD